MPVFLPCLSTSATPTALGGRRGGRRGQVDLRHQLRAVGRRWSRSTSTASSSSWDVDDVAAGWEAVVVEFFLLSPPLSSAITTMAATTTSAPSDSRMIPPRRELGRAARPRGWEAPAGSAAGAGDGSAAAPAVGATGSGAGTAAAAGCGSRAPSVGISGSGLTAIGSSSEARTRAHARSLGRLRKALTGVLGHLRRQLTEQVVGDQRPALGRHARRRAERVERRKRPLAHAGAVDRQHPRDLVIRPSALEDQLENGALIGRQAVQRSHGDH